MVAALTTTIVLDGRGRGAGVRETQGDPVPVRLKRVRTRTDVVRMAATITPTAPLAWSTTPVMRLWRLVTLAGFVFLLAHLAFGLGGSGLDHFADRWVYDGLEV